VYSAIEPDPDDPGWHREVVETLWRARTVEGDLGVRWNAPGVVAAAVAEQLLDDAEASWLAVAAQQRAADPSMVPGDGAGRSVDVRIAELAVTVALRRHARPQEYGAVRHPGRDLRKVTVVVGSGGVLRHGSAADVRRVLGPVLADHAGGWRLPQSARLAVDRRYVLAAAGLLATEHRVAAARLAAMAAQGLPERPPRS
jgi:uncharacterized protein (TIGR01319 family)